MTHRVYVIAEVGSVHDGSLGNAKRLAEVAKRCGADAVKYQTHISSAETLRNAPLPPYFKGEPRYEYFERTGFTEDQWRELRLHCDAVDIEFMSSPFSEEAVDLLERIGIKKYKVPSGEVTNTGLLEKISHLGKPVLLSSGMSSWEELDRAVAIVKASPSPLTVMQCTTEYPCQYECVGLNVIEELKERYGVDVGYSDHTLTNYAAYAAVVLGACVVEKHLTFSRQMYGSDAPNAAEPEQFKDLVDGIRAIEIMMDNPVDKSDASEYAEMKNIFEKSIVSVVDIPAGTIINREMLGLKKPGDGLPAMYLDRIVGRKATKHIAKDSQIILDQIDSENRI